MYEDRTELQRLELDRQSIVYATYVDEGGVSVYAKRGGRKSDIEGFIANGQMANWMSYFELDGFEPANRAYAGQKHFSRRFPRDIV